MENPEIQRVYLRGWRERNKDAAKSIQLKSKRGLTLDHYNEILERQGGRCAICKSEDPIKGKFFHVDHDHSSGRIRGLLCMNCNTGLGQLKDNKAILEAAILYLSNNVDC